MIENDEIFDALSDARRRKLLVALLAAEPQRVAGLSDSARELTEAHDTYLREFLDGPMEMEGVEKAVVALHHLHLPKLADQGFVEWTPGAEEVRRGDRFEELRPVLELLAEAERTESEPEIVTSPR